MYVLILGVSLKKITIKDLAHHLQLHILGCNFGQKTSLVELKAPKNSSDGFLCLLILYPLL